jgi:hypothetical protein
MSIADLLGSIADNEVRVNVRETERGPTSNSVNPVNPVQSVSNGSAPVSGVNVSGVHGNSTGVVDSSHIHSSSTQSNGNHNQNGIVAPPNRSSNIGDVYAAGPSTSGIASTIIQSNNPASTVSNGNVLSAVSVVGKVTRVDNKRRKGRDNKLNVFYLHVENLDREFRCHCEFFCPVHDGDSLEGMVVLMKDKKGEFLNFVRKPFVEICMDRSSIIRYWKKVLRGTGFGNVKGGHLYDTLERLSGDREVTEYLSDYASKFVAKKSVEYLSPLLHDLNQKQAEKLMEAWYKARNLRRLYLLGLNNKEIDGAYMSADKIYELCMSNPFRVLSIPTDKCIEICNHVGIEPTDDQLRCAIISRRLKNNVDNSEWTCTPAHNVLREFPDFVNRYEALVEDYGICMNFDSIYLGYQNTVEGKVAEYLINLMYSDRPVVEEPVFSNPLLTEEQMAAVTMSLCNNVSIITGGAGTGKTTIIREIVYNLETLEIPYAVTSFTGKAVARIREVIGKQAPSTMHMMKASPNKYAFNILIIDETSMVNMNLFYKFIEVFTHNFRIVFVGDFNQLQPIGWGALFHQLVNSGTLPIARLSKNHRSDAVVDIDGIVENSNAIINYSKLSRDERVLTPLNFINTANFSLFDGSLDNVVDFVDTLHRNGVNQEAITVIAPYNNVLRSLNIQCQQIFNDGNRSVVDPKGVLWMVGDKVMMKENNYDINIMNGEEGIIVDLNDNPVDKTVVVKFKNGHQHEFHLDYTDNTDYYNNPRKNNSKNENEIYLQIKQITHSYAMTVHKSQGSEWEYVILYIPDSTSNSGFLDRTLIYTAITRARKAFWFVGDQDALIAGSKKEPTFRCDNLSKRLVANKHRIVEQTTMTS